MLVDLGRNDVGRVAKYGTVEISDVMVIERYSHVMHITSNVTGQLADRSRCVRCAGGVLAGGDGVGAPKVRAMEIIDELEPHRRGPYAGAVGYIDFAGNMDTCIALRTIVVQRRRRTCRRGRGSWPIACRRREYEETLNKARGLLKAIEITRERAVDNGSGEAPAEPFKVLARREPRRHPIRSVDRPEGEVVLVFDVDFVIYGDGVGVGAAFGDFVAGEFGVGVARRFEDDEFAGGGEGE